MSARSVVTCRALLLVAVVALVGVPRGAQDPVPQQPIHQASEASPDQIPVQPPVAVGPPATAKRPAMLAPLWGSYIALQAFDVHSTRRALSSGAGREANPLLTGVAHNSAGLIAVKAASTAGVIYGTEKLWKKNRVLAVVAMVGLNSATAYVVARNYRVTR